VIPQSPTAKYLGIHLDSRLTWAQHLAKKRKQLDLKVKDLYWVIGRKSPASLESKVLLFKTIMKPIWTYGIELWRCASKSHIAKMQQSQSKILRMITNAPWYVTNQTLHENLKVPFIKDVIQEKSINHHDKLGNHSSGIACGKANFWFFCRVGAPPPRLKAETDPVSETLCFLFVEIRKMDKVQKLNSNES
jgi:hypothetical protein